MPGRELEIEDPELVTDSSVTVLVSCEPVSGLATFD